MVAAFELDDGVAAGVTTGQADGTHGGLGTGADHAYHLHGRHDAADEVRHLGFHGGRRAVGQAVLQLVAHRIKHVRVGVAEDHRAPGADVVDIALVVLVDHIGAFGVLEEQRCAANAPEGAYRRVDAAGDVLLGIGKQGFGTGHGSSLSNQDDGNSALKARARLSTSAAEEAENRAWTTASRSAPAPIS